MTEQRPSKFAILRTWINRIFIVVVLAGIVLSLVDKWSEIQSFNWQIQPVGIVVSILAYIAFFLIRGVSWVRILNLLEVKISFQVGFRVYLYTYLSRYIPGGIWLIVTLNTIAQSLGQSKRIFTFAFVVNIVLLIFVDLIFLLLFVYEIIGVLGFILYGLSIFFIPHILRFGFKKLARFNFVPQSTNLTELTESNNVFRLLNLTIAHQVFQLLAYFIFAYSMMALTTSQIAYISVAYAISWLIGFLVVFVPQGLGVREATFMLLTAPLISGEVAIALSVALRLLTIVCELLVFFGYLVYNKYHQEGS